ncbi:MAG: high-affinity nickel-transport family protein [Polyangiaceae bacterium]|nr:high-affinity nickel-transport family protein [Polyangiaceae bacterium]
MTLLAILVLGFFLGMRHATDADHVVAVTTIVSRQRSLRGAVAVGALWGLGHTVTILLVGGAIVVLGLVIPPRLGLSMELSVAVMLVVLGFMNIAGAKRRVEEVAHGEHPGHVHTGLSERPPGTSTGKWPLASLRPLFVGVVHGLAGSAAIALLVLATIRQVGWALLYLGIFGAGTILGMMVLTTAMAVPVRAASARFGSLEHVMARATGVLSILFGLFLAYQIGFVDGLFVGEPNWSPR